MADKASLDGLGDVSPNRFVFTGSIAAAGTGGTVGEVLNGTLEGSRSFAEGASLPARMVRFTGTLTLPSRPVVTLSLSATETPATASAPASLALTGRYVQDAITLQATGSRSGSSQSLTLADSSGVTVSLVAGVNSAAVTVSGRAAATIDNSRGRITYVDGTFESLN